MLQKLTVFIESALFLLDPLAEQRKCCFLLPEFSLLFFIMPSLYLKKLIKDMAIEGNESTGNTFGNVAKITYIVLFLIRKLFRQTWGEKSSKADTSQ